MFYNWKHRDNGLNNISWCQAICPQVRKDRASIFKRLCSPGIDSASLCSLAGPYDNPIPTRFLAPTDCLKILALGTLPVVFSVKGLMSSSENGTGHLRMKTWIYLNDVRMSWSDSTGLQVCLFRQSQVVRSIAYFHEISQNWVSQYLLF